MSIKDITIVITSFRSEKKIRKCLNSINRECQVINVENSDNLKYKQNIEKEFKNVRCILTGENLGYGNANNIGLEKVNTKFALILNPDTQLFPNTLEKFLHATKQKLDFAIIGPHLVQDKNNYKENEVLGIEKVKFVKGFAMLLNLSEFKEVGFFDKKIFIYLEEIDLCKRLTKNNKKIYQSKDIPIYHEGGQSHDSNVDYQMELSRNWHWMWSTFYYNKKHKGFYLSLLMIFPKLISTIFRILLYTLIFNKNKKNIYYQRFSGMFNSIIGKSSWYRPKI